MRLSPRDATDRCKIVDKHMLLLAPKHMETKFVKVQRCAYMRRPFPPPPVVTCRIAPTAGQRGEEPLPVRASAHRYAAHNR